MVVRAKRRSDRGNTVGVHLLLSLGVLGGVVFSGTFLWAQDTSPPGATPPASTLAPTPPSSDAPLPLVPPPATTGSDDPATVPGTSSPPALEYDPRYLYLPPVAPRRGPDVCYPPGRWWVRPALELAWWPVPPLQQNLRLAIPDQDGSAFLGPYLLTAGRDVPTFQAAFSLNGGFWLDSLNRWGVEAGLFVLGGNATIFPGYAPEMLVLFPDGVRGGAPQLLVFPPGTPLLDVFPLTYTSWYITADVNYRHNLLCTPQYRLDLLLGYRHAFAQDELYFGEPPDGSTVDQHRFNRLAASNPFHGGQVGLAGEYRGGPWFVAGAVKVAWGVVTPKIESTGLFTGTFAPGPAAWQRPAGLDSRWGERFAVLPALEVTVGRQVGNHLRLYAGYTFHYLSRSIRLADALDPRTTPRLTDLWLQSLSLGLEARF
ncbi:MAG: BBP7 family outer membrane beta-barrel protein [Gemmataceae bacterium]|nr:BBP7 family outer membrane beta-barrel protein [Gemmataceae bacterium]